MWNYCWLAQHEFIILKVKKKVPRFKITVNCAGRFTDYLANT